MPLSPPTDLPHPEKPQASLSPRDSVLKRARGPFSSTENFFKKLGPGLITGASDDDPSGIATYSQAGAQFGYGMLWTLILTYPLMCAIQEISAQIGRVTGRGIAANLRASHSKWILYPIISLLLIVNTVNVGVDLGAMGSAAQLVFGGSFGLYCVLFALISVLAQVFIPYHRYVNYIKWTTLVLFTYVAIVFTVQIPWGTVLHQTFLPKISLSGKSLQMLIAILGTTISPYLFFWQASTEVEDERLDPLTKSLKRAPEQAPAQLSRIRQDTLFGMGISNLIAFFIILTTAATLNAHGQTQIETAAQAAEALRPIAGKFCFLLFSLGMIGTGLLAIPVLAGSAAYAVGESFCWRVGLEKRPRRAPKFYAVIAGATAIGVLINFMHINPIKALFWTAILNGVVAVPIMPMMMLLASNKKVMGEFTITPLLKQLGWIATGVMALAALGLLYQSIF